jgi:prepilin-type N-terminal cleavage/methylation domain-containing protein
MKNIQDSLFMSELQQMRKNFANKGFTLLEVMIAVALIAIALTTLLGSQSQSVSFANSRRACPLQTVRNLKPRLPCWPKAR